MSGILRLANTGTGTGRSTLQSNASNDVTFSLPDTGTDSSALILTDDMHSISTINWTGINVNINTGDLNVDNGLLFVDESTNRVGIGTGAPVSKLHVNDTGETRILVTSASNAEDRGYYFGNANAASILGYIKQEYTSGKLEISSGTGSNLYDIGFRTGGVTDRAVIKANGQIGIGTNNPFELVHLHSATSGVGPILQLTNDTGDCRIFFGQNTEVGSANAQGQIRYNVANNLLNFYTSGTDKLRIDTAGRISTGGATTTDSFFTVRGDLISTAVNAYIIRHFAEIQNGVTGTAVAFHSTGNIASGTTISNYQHYVVAEGTTTGVTLTNQFGIVINDLNAGVNNQGMFCNISAGSGKYNLFIQGTANNYIAGNTGFGSGNVNPTYPLSVNGTGTFGAISGTNATVVLGNGGTIGSIEAHQGSSVSTKVALCLNAFGGRVGVGTNNPNGNIGFHVAGQQGGSATHYGIFSNTSPPTSATSEFAGYLSSPYTQDTNTQYAAVVHYIASQGTITGGSRVAPTIQVGFRANNNLAGAGTNLGFQSSLSSGTGKWNIYSDGTAGNYFAGNVAHGSTNNNPVANNIFGFAIRTDGHFLSNTTSSGSVSGIRRNGDGDVLRFYQNSTTDCGAVRVQGTQTFYDATSDYRLKENIVPITNGIERVLKLKPCRFNFKEYVDQVLDGFLAHEAQEVVPEAVSGPKDGEEYQSMDTGRLIPILTAALQEAVAEIESLKARVSILEK